MKKRNKIILIAVIIVTLILIFIILQAKITGDVIAPKGAKCYKLIPCSDIESCEFCGKSKTPMQWKVNLLPKNKIEINPQFNFPNNVFNYPALYSSDIENFVNNQEHTLKVVSSGDTCEWREDTTHYWVNAQNGMNEKVDISFVLHNNVPSWSVEILVKTPYSSDINNAIFHAGIGSFGCAKGNSKITDWHGWFREADNLQDGALSLKPIFSSEILPVEGSETCGGGNPVIGFSEGNLLSKVNPDKKYIISEEGDSEICYYIDSAVKCTKAAESIIPVACCANPATACATKPTTCEAIDTCTCQPGTYNLGGYKLYVDASKTVSKGGFIFEIKSVKYTANKNPKQNGKINVDGYLKMNGLGFAALDKVKEKIDAGDYNSFIIKDSRGADFNIINFIMGKLFADTGETTGTITIDSESGGNNNYLWNFMLSGKMIQKYYLGKDKTLTWNAKQDRSTTIKREDVKRFMDNFKNKINEIITSPNLKLNDPVDYKSALGKGKMQTGFLKEGGNDNPVAVVKFDDGKIMYQEFTVETKLSRSVLYTPPEKKVQDAGGVEVILKCFTATQPATQPAK